MGLKLKSSGGTGSVQLNCPDNHNLDTSFTLPTTNVTGGEFVLADGSGNVNIDSGTLYVDAVNNRVGVGTASPQTLLDLESDTPIIRFTDANATGTPECDVSGAGGNLTFAADLNNAKSDSTIKFQIDNSEVARLDSSGNMGINNTSPGSYNSYGLPLVVTNAGSPHSGITITSSTSGTGNIHFADGSSGGSSYRGIIQYNHNGDYMSLHTTEAERMRIDNSGDVSIEQGKALTWRYQTGSTVRGKIVCESTDAFKFYQGASSIERFTFNTSGYFYFNPTGVQGRLFLNTTNANRSFGEVSTGSGSNTVYIGNAAIQVSSDERIKENIQDTQLDALAAVKQISVKDFTWNDPKDTSHNNRNARGTWTGVIAQELVEILPFVVNAPRNEDTLEIDHDSEEIWTLDQSQLCPVLIKAMQQQQAMIETLQANNVSLEAKVTELETQNASFEARLAALEGGTTE